MTTRRARKIGLLAFAVLLAACSETANAPTAPLAQKIRLTPPAAVRHNYSSVNWPNVTITDEGDGISYTYNHDGRTVTRSSDGLIVYLDEAQAAATLTNFLQVTEADDTDVGFANACSPENPCAEPMSTTPAPLGSEPGFDSPISVTLDFPASRPLPGRSARLFTLPPELQPQRQKKNSISPLYFDGYCSDIIMSVTGNRFAFSNARTSVAKAIFSAVVSEGVNFGLGKLLPEGVLSSAAIMTVGLDFVSHGVRLGVLRTLWNSHNCSERDIVVGNYFYPGSPTTPTALLPYIHCDIVPGAVTILGETVLVSFSICYFSNEM